ncbi:MAG: carboxypeptidase regulatory-like domain-containing protein [Bacteroidetes bacterium]|nr:carboxypeptidase regulatory-like domain-containing protein [Bacteroidota bacterium]
MRLVWLSALFLSVFLRASGQTVELCGIVSDSLGKALPFVSASTGQVYRSAVTNDSGFYRLNVQPGTYTLNFRSPGYKPVSRTIVAAGAKVQLDLQLMRADTSSQPAGHGDSIIQMTIAMKNRQAAQPGAYSGTLYTKAVQYISEDPKSITRDVLAYALNMDRNNKGIVNLSESIADFQMRPGGRISKEVTAAIIKQSSKKVFNFDKIPEIYIDLYQNTIYLYGLSEFGFISPLADNAPGYYHYRLTGQFTDDQRIIDEISVEPIGSDERLFSGKVYVIDKEWQLYGVNLQLSRKANMDFIDSVYISQQYAPMTGHVWMTRASRLKFYGSFWGFKYSGSFLQVYQDIHTDSNRVNIYRNHYYSHIRDYKKDADFWKQNRPQPLTSTEQSFYLSPPAGKGGKGRKSLLGYIRSQSNQFRVLPYMFWGYTRHNYDNNSSIGLPSLYNTIFYNTVEGWGIDLNIKYTKIYDRLQSLSITPEIRYGFSDKVLNGNLLVNYVYNSFRHAYVFGRAGADFLDLNSTGTISPFLNSLTTLYLSHNYIKLYQSKFITAGTGGEVTGGILMTGQLEYAERAPLFNTTRHTFNKDSILLTSNNPLDPNADNPLFPKYRALTLRGSVTFTFNQEYTITPDGRFILPTSYPVVRINYRTGIPTLGSSVNYSFISADVFQDRLNEGIIGYTAFYFSAGKFLSNRLLYYPDYNHFHGGQSFFFDTYAGSFHFLNYYTYSTDKAYFEAHAEHNFTGYFLSRAPLLHSLGLQEIIGASYLSQGTLPDYKEIYVGLKRSMLRLDYGFAFGRFSKIIQGFRFSYNVSGR